MMARTYLSGNSIRVTYSGVEIVGVLPQDNTNEHPRTNH